MLNDIQVLQVHLIELVDDTIGYRNMTVSK